MLDRLDRDLVSRQRRRELDAREVLDGRRNLVTAEVGPPEPDAEVREAQASAKAGLCCRSGDRFRRRKSGGEVYAGRPLASQAVGERALASQQTECLQARQ